MPSHWSTIGFDIQTAEDAAALAQKVVGDSKPFRTKVGRYLRWRGGGGEELWLQVNAGNELIGMHPHFEGESAIRVGLQNRVHRGDDTVLDGAFHGWADPESADAITNGAYPFVFDLPDAAMSAGLELPSIQTVQIAAFAHTLTAYASLAAYEASQVDEEPKFASQSLIPSGLFSPTLDPKDPPQAEVIFTGHVVRTAMKKNAITGAPFGWALVETLGGTYDVVFDALLLDQPPVVGGVMHGSFWLSGRLTSQPKRKRGLWGALFGRS